MEETRTPKTGRDWRIFLTLDLDQIPGAGHGASCLTLGVVQKVGAGHFSLTHNSLLSHSVPTLNSHLGE